MHVESSTPAVGLALTLQLMKQVRGHLSLSGSLLSGSGHHFQPSGLAGCTLWLHKRERTIVKWNLAPCSELRVLRRPSEFQLFLLEPCGLTWTRPCDLPCDWPGRYNGPSSPFSPGGTLCPHGIGSSFPLLGDADLKAWPFTVCQRGLPLGRSMSWC